MSDLAAGSPATPSTPEPQMAVRVTADRILCGAPGGEKRSRGGILIPATAASKDRHGVWAEVIDVGPLVRSCEVGDMVLFLPDSAIEVDVHGDDYLVVREREIHAIASPERDPDGTGLYL